MASSITLLCAILGPDIGNPFSIVIPPDQYVAELKKAIKKEKQPELDHVAADKLGVYKLLVPISEERIVETLGEIDNGEKLPNAERAQATKKLSRYFQTPAEEMVHLVVQAPTPSLPVSISHTSMDEEIAEIERHAIRSSWRTTYEGNAHHRLYTAIKDMQKEAKQLPYGNMMTIIQSSGTGKSRMVDQLARIVFTLPFNIRDPSDSIQGAFPDPDSLVQDMFSVKPIGNTKPEAAARYDAFFSALFDRVQVALTQYNSDSSPRLPEWWYHYLLDSSSVTLEEKEKYANNRQKLYGEAVNDHETIFTELLKVNTTSDTNDTNFDEVHKEAQKLATESAERLQATIKSISKTGRIIMYFDESHTLFHLPLRDRSSRYAALCRALDNMSKTKIFSLFLSTNSNLSRYAPPRDQAFSSRTSGADGLRAPFTELPFDCHPDFPISQGQYTLATSGKLSFLSQFGRPLFWTRYKSGVEDTDRIVVALATSKLAPGVDTNYRKDQGKDLNLAQLAVLDIRLLLAFEPNAKGVKAQEDMVAGRMRIAHSVPKHREYMRSSYPSEPILAEAAAHIWEKYQQGSERPEAVIPEMLQEHLMAGVIGKGERGELVARLLLTLAYDAAVRRCGSELHTRAVPLATFLQELFGEANYAIIANSKPDVGDLKFCDAFKDAQVRFTHFVRAGDDSVVSTDAAYVAILRSMAFQCSHGQEAIDGLVPIALMDGALEESNMSGMAVSVKDRLTAGSKASFSDINPSKLSFFPKDQELFQDTGSGRPFISLVMELGISTKETPAAGGGYVNRPPSKRRKVGDVPLEVAKPKVVRPTRGAEMSDPEKPEPPQNPHYHIYAYSCSPSVYKVVTNKDIFASLLSSRDLLAEHPRQTDTFLKAVKQQKPFWSRGIESYGWLDGVKALHNTSVTEQARVEVGMDADETDADETDADETDADEMDVE